MSHFTVAVITKERSREAIEKILEPYWEEIEVEPYVDETKEQMIKKAKKIQERYLKEIEEGKEFTEQYILKYVNAKTDEELYEAYKDEDDKYDENGNHLTTYNPNSKWDWYDIGGRWRNLILTPERNNDTFENNSFAELFSGVDSKREAPEGYKWVNGAKIKEINFKKMEELFKEPFITWALVDENFWLEQGNMGWWALNDATEESEDAFKRHLKAYLEDPDNQEKYLTIVDCHI